METFPLGQHLVYLCRKELASSSLQSFCLFDISTSLAVEIYTKKCEFPVNFISSQKRSLLVSCDARKSFWKTRYKNLISLHEIWVWFMNNTLLSLSKVRWLRFFASIIDVKLAQKTQWSWPIRLYWLCQNVPTQFVQSLVVQHDSLSEWGAVEQRFFGRAALH